MEEALNDGMGFDGSSITGFNAIEESDMVAIPDPATFQLMPRPVDDHGHAIGANVARMICDVVTPDGSPYEGDPRFALRKALERMQAMGSTRSTSVPSSSTSCSRTTGARRRSTKAATSP